MAKEGFLCVRRDQSHALACLVCLEPQWYTRACCGEGGREHLWCAVQYVAAQHEQQQLQQQQKRVGAVLSTPHMHTQWWTHGRAPKVHTVVCTPVCVCVPTHNACAGWCARHSHGWRIFERHCRQQWLVGFGNAATHCFSDGLVSVLRPGVLCWGRDHALNPDAWFPYIDMSQWYIRVCCGEGGSALFNPKP